MSTDARLTVMPPIRLSDAIIQTTCYAPEGRLCRCEACTEWFNAVLTAASDASTTSSSLDVEVQKCIQGLETPKWVQGLPLRAFARPEMVFRSIYDYQSSGASASEAVKPNKHNKPLSQIPSRAQSHSRTDPASSLATDRTILPPRVNALRHDEDVTPTMIPSTIYEYDGPTTFLHPFELTDPSGRVQCLDPTHSNYNLDPTPAIPLGRPDDCRRSI